MKRFSISPLLSIIIIFGLFINISYAKTKELVFHRDKIPNYLFYETKDFSYLCEDCKKFDVKKHVKYCSILKSRTITENLKDQDAIYWLQNKYQDKYSIVRIEIKKIERNNVFSLPYNRQTKPVERLKGIKAIIWMSDNEHHKCKQNKITWVVFEMTYTPKKIMRIINTNINSSSSTSVIS